MYNVVRTVFDQNPHQIEKTERTVQYACPSYDPWPYYAASLLLDGIVKMLGSVIAQGPYINFKIFFFIGISGFEQVCKENLYSAGLQ